MYPTIR
ncbi:hypothetical protein GQ607_015898 [Colletotrichum asianum]|nr:hypothetical protein GQ607_015898 [Colletotrichum asianum]